MHRTHTSRRPRLSDAARQLNASRALERARLNTSLENEMAVTNHFTARGYTDVRPRENVLTFAAWKALGRSVKRGEKGFAITSYAPAVIRQVDSAGHEVDETYTRPHTAYVFHELQTRPLDG